MLRQRYSLILKTDGCAILNNDDDKVAALKDSIKNKIITYGIKGRSDVSAKNIRLSLDSSEFDVVTPKGSFKVSTPLIGRHNVSNILAAVAACDALGIDLKTIKAGIEAMSLFPGGLNQSNAARHLRYLWISLTQKMLLIRY